MSRSVEGTTSLSISEDAKQAISKFTEISVDKYRAGSMSKADWEHARSYAVEAVHALLLANPEVFDYVGRIEAVRVQQQEKRA